jgi:hypothetical protein
MLTLETPFGIRKMHDEDKRNFLFKEFIRIAGTPQMFFPFIPGV